MNTPIKHNLKPHKTHCLALMPEDAQGNPHKTELNPILCVANENGYYPLQTVNWPREVAQQYVDQYNRDVLGLSPAQAAAIFDSTMFTVKYPAHAETLKKTGKFEQWPSERKS